MSIGYNPIPCFITKYDYENTSSYPTMKETHINITTVINSYNITITFTKSQEESWQPTTPTYDGYIYVDQINF